MKRIITLLLVLSLLVSFAACGGSEEESKAPDVSAEVSESVESSEESSEEESMAVPDENAKKIWKDEYADEAASLSSTDDIYKADYYFNGVKTDDYSVSPADGDGKYVFSGLENSRFVNVTDICSPFRLPMFHSTCPLPNTVRRSSRTSQSFPFPARIRTRTATPRTAGILTLPNGSP